MTTILVTGSTGFIGRPLCRALQEAGFQVRRAVRRADSFETLKNVIDYCAVGVVGPETDWSEALDGVRAVVHLVARAHVMDEKTGEPLATFRHVNALGTERLARQAAAAGVRRLVFVSSVKVNGEQTRERPFSETDLPHPQDPYAVSKWETEQALRRIAEDTGLETVVVRPPLVYGPGVKGNFLRLLKAIDRGLPLPLANVDNRRSLVGLSNLVDFLVLCVHHPDAAGEVFVIAHGEDVSTPELIRRLARAIGRPARLWPCPVGLLRLAARAAGKESAIERLCGSLTVDSAKAHTLLSWTSLVPMAEELARVAQWWRLAAADGP